MVRFRRNAAYQPFILSQIEIIVKKRKCSEIRHEEYLYLSIAGISSASEILARGILHFAAGQIR